MDVQRYLLLWDPVTSPERCQRGSSETSTKLFILVEKNPTLTPVSPPCFSSPTCPSSFSVIINFYVAFQITQIINNCKIQVTFPQGQRRLSVQILLGKKYLKQRRKTERLVFHVKQFLHSYHNYKKFSNFYVEKIMAKNLGEKKTGEITEIYMINGRSFYKLKDKRQDPIQKLAKNTNKQFRGRKTNYH